MSDRWTIEGFLEPITEAEPCGKNLEDTGALGLLDAYQIFGQTTLEPESKKPGDPVAKEARKSDRPPNWREIRDAALESLTKSKDLRLLAYLGAAELRTDGFGAFVDSLTVASKWLETFWGQVHPVVDEDALLRKNALNCFADPLAVIDALRKAPLVESRQHGRFGLRDIEIAEGLVVPGQTDAPTADSARITAAFENTPLEKLQALHDAATRALATAGQIDGLMRREAGIEGALSFEPLTAQLVRMSAVVKDQMASHPAASGTDGQGGGAEATGGAGAGVIAVGGIKSRQDAIRALDAAAEFFRRNEPSSPVPLLVDRAKRLVSKDFLEVLADVAPEALPQARAAGGLRND